MCLQESWGHRDWSVMDVGKNVKGKSWTMEMVKERLCSFIVKKKRAVWEVRCFSTYGMVKGLTSLFLEVGSVKNQPLWLNPKEVLPKRNMWGSVVSPTVKRPFRSPRDEVDENYYSQNLLQSKFFSRGPPRISQKCPTRERANNDESIIQRAETQMTVVLASLPFSLLANCSFWRLHGHDLL